MKEVNQFPSDIECMRYIATIADKVTIAFLLPGVMPFGAENADEELLRAVTSNPDFFVFTGAVKEVPPVYGDHR